MLNKTLLLNNSANIQQNSSNQPNVIIRWNGSGIHNITGPVPLVDINNSINNGSNDLPETNVTSINMEGKIIRFSDPTVNANLDPPISGISGILGAINSLKKLFSCTVGTFEILCDNNIIYSASGAIVKNIDFNKTNDNWTKTADFSISLEHITPIVNSGEGPFNDVANKNDRWTVEQIDDTFYTNSAFSISHQQAEYSNPILGATSSSQIPPVNVGGGNIPSASTNIRIINLPQFRITHTVSAKGLVPTTGTGLACQDLSTINRTCLENAKKWVNFQLSRSVGPYAGNPQINSGVMPFIADPPNLASGLFFYNHIRSINIDYTTYEVNDSWLAVPSGIPYTETYSIETSVDESFTKTVRVAGNIVGLHPFSTGLVISSGSGLGIDPIKPLNMSLMTTGNNITKNTVPLDGPAGNLTTSRNNSIYNNKYENALSGWLYDIKPHLYRRACLGVNSVDRTLEYVDPATRTNTNPGPPPPNNPIYSKERPLSTIPRNMTEGYDPRRGTISYSAEYNNSFKIISGVISENIDVSFSVPRDEVSTIVIPGRALGPILSRTGRSASTKTLNISVVVYPPSGLSGLLLNNEECPMYTGGHVYRTILDIINGNKPFTGSKLISSKNPNGIVFTQNDNEQWNPTAGRYSRNVTWIYQACDLSKDYMNY